MALYNIPFDSYKTIAEVINTYGLNMIIVLLVLMVGTRYISRIFHVQKMFQSTVAGTAVKASSTLVDTGLFKMPNIPDSPFSLFKKWYTEQQDDLNPLASNALCLSTATKDGKVSSRSLIMRRLDEDGFVIMTDSRSKKSKELAENPSAAMTFLWFKVMNGVVTTRQVRIEGDIKMLPEPNWIDIYEKEPVFCKIRSYVCHQGQPVKWEALKQNHDQILEKYLNGKHELEKPKHVVAYKLTANMMEFYETTGPMIADRVMYLKEDNKWKNNRIAA